MAQYFNDFSEFAVGAGAPSGFTLRGNTNWSLSVGDEDDNPGLSGKLTGNRALRIAEQGSGEYNSMVSFDAAGQTSGDVDVIVRAVANHYINETVGAGVRSGSGPIRWSIMNVNRDNFRTRVNDSITTYPVTEWDNYTPAYYRYRITGGQVKAVAGTTLASVQGENPTWLHDVADPDSSATGYIGAVMRGGDGDRWVDWIAVGTGGDLAPTSAVGVAIPTGFAFTAHESAEQLDGSWSAVSGADSYDWEVERNAAGSWVAFDTGTTSGTSFQLTDVHGVVSATTYRARVRSVQV